MLDTLGFERGVLVQGSAHGQDNSAMLDALERTPTRLRGVAVVDENVSPVELRRSCVSSPVSGNDGRAQLKMRRAASVLSDSSRERDMYLPPTAAT